MALLLAFLIGLAGLVIASPAARAAYAEAGATAAAQGEAKG